MLRTYLKAYCFVWLIIGLSGALGLLGFALNENYGDIPFVLVLKQIAIIAGIMIFIELAIGGFIHFAGT